MRYFIDLFLAISRQELLVVCCQRQRVEESISVERMFYIPSAAPHLTPVLSLGEGSTHGQGMLAIYATAGIDE
jgi:hypothetical protein